MDIKTFIESQKITLAPEQETPTVEEKKDYDEAKLAEAYKLIQSVSKNNGFTAIAMKTKLPRHAVKELHREYLAKYAELESARIAEKIEAEKAKETTTPPMEEIPKL